MSNNERDSNTLWLYHGPPKDDELFASWLTRITFWQGQQENIARFLNRMFSDLPRATPSRLLHGEIPQEWIRRLSDVTGQPMEKLEHTISASNWFSITKTDHRLSFSVTLFRYCPLCLLEDGKKGDIPYLRQVWSFPSLVICCEHSVLLQDTCPSCGCGFTKRYTSIWKYSHSKKRHGCLELVCPECDTDLSTAQTVHIAPKSPLMELSRITCSALRNPHKKIPWGKYSLDSKEFLLTLSILSRFYVRCLQKDPRSTEGVMHSLQQVAEWWKTWPDGFEEWLSLKRESQKWTNESRFRSFLWNVIVRNGKRVPDPLKKHVPRLFERRVRAWTFDVVVKFMRDWVKKNPKKYPTCNLPELAPISRAIRGKRVITHDGTRITSWLQFPDILRSMGMDIPPRPTGFIKKMGD